MTKYALITGASAGIGLELAKLFAADGHGIALVARRRDRLEQLAGELEREHQVPIQVIAEDLAERGAPARIVEELEHRGVAVEYLVNNAGFGTHGAFAELPLERELDQIQVNIVALVSLTRLLLPRMLQRGSGRILNVGSTAGFQPGPQMAVYYATKAFVNHFSEALSFELKGSGVTATVSCPGATATEFAELAGNHKSRLFAFGAASAEQVARQAYRAMHDGKPMIVHGLKNKLGVQSLRVAPRAMVRSLAASLNRS